MTRLLRIPLICLCLMGLLTTLSLRAATAPFPVDSVGVEKRDGKRFIVHHVDQGQTLYAIARRYKTSVAALREANPDIKDAVRYDQVVRVPLADLSRKERKAIDKVIRESEKEADAAKESKSVSTKPSSDKSEKNAEPVRKASGKAEPVVSGNSGIHVVQSGQTLYSLAVRYGVLQANLRKWNNLNSDNVLIGQALIVSERAYTARQPANAPKPEPVKPSPKASTPKPAPKADKSTSAATPPAERERTNPPATASTTDGPAEEPKVIRAGDSAPLPTHGRRVSDLGLAEAIEGNGDSGKYLALHRSAPIGMLVQVRNDVNNQSIWVKVIGRLPDTGVNDRILIKLSARAFAKLSPNDRRFRTEVSYIIP
ncbi:MAG: LysM peptidoglycan-binding domain-containing protein [Bacteroidetes bacterium]|nr:LysM peptidoglycan-binding domain-containing protein [Fibrella sp.]